MGRRNIGGRQAYISRQHRDIDFFNMQSWIVREYLVYS